MKEIITRPACRQFRPLTELRMIECDKRWGTSRTKRCEQEKRGEIRSKDDQFWEICEWDIEHCIQLFIYCKPVKILENRSDMIRHFGVRVMPEKLKTVNLSIWKIKQKRAAIVNFGVNERSSNSWSSSTINYVSYASEIPNIKEDWFRNRIDVLIFIKDDTKVPSRVNR